MRRQRLFFPSRSIRSRRRERRVAQVSASVQVSRGGEKMMGGEGGRRLWGRAPVAAATMGWVAGDGGG